MTEPTHEADEPRVESVETDATERDRSEAGRTSRDGRGTPDAGAAGNEPDTADPRDAPDTADTRNAPALPFETTPALKPTLLLIALTLFVGTVTVGYLVANPETVAGDPGLTELVWNAVGVLVVLLLVRLVLRLYLLSRTRYVVDSDAVRREFSLLYRHESREVPLAQLRGHEFSQNRVQRLLGFGTVRMLTGGTNRSLGFVEFEDLPQPARVRDLLRSLVAGDGGAGGDTEARP